MKMTLLAAVGALALSGCVVYPTGKAYTESYTTVCTTQLRGHGEIPKSELLQFCGCAAKSVTQGRESKIISIAYSGIRRCASVLSGPSASEFVKRANELANYNDPNVCGVTFGPCYVPPHLRKF